MNYKEKLWIHVVADLAMIALILLNINLIIFDSIFEVKLVKQFFLQIAPDFYHWYNINIHEHFGFIDLVFVAFLLVEFHIRWVVAIFKKSYEKWYFFPFLFWYDLLGCVPISGFRWLRLLRVFSLMIRLEKLGLVVWKQTVFYKYFRRFSNIIIEEISDRVVVKVLEGVKMEVAKGNPVSDEIIREVIKPQIEILVMWLSHRTQTVTANVYSRKKDDLKKYIDGRINQAVTSNKQVKLISNIPLVGDRFGGMLEQAISDIVFNVVDGLFTDLRDNNKPLMKELANVSTEMLTLIEDDKELDTIIENIINQSIDVIIRQVEIKEWKNQ